MMLFHMRKIEKIKNTLSKSQNYFCLDFNSLKRIGILSKEIEKLIFIVMIDHHESPEKIFNPLLSKPQIGSTCELHHNVMKSINHKLIGQKIATYIYSGILTDTGSFRFPLTSGTHILIISELFKKGIDHTKIHEKIYDNFSFDRISFLSIALKNLKLIEKLRCCLQFYQKRI